MESPCGFLLPLKLNTHTKIKILDKINFRKSHDINTTGPFFHIENANSAVESFLDAIMHSSTEEARKFISPDFNNLLDLEMLQESFSYVKSYKHIFKTDFLQIKTKSKRVVGSVLLIGKQHNARVIIDFYLLNQPDNFSKWKIYALASEV